MKRYWLSLFIAVTATVFMLYQNGLFAQQAQQVQESQLAGAPVQAEDGSDVAVKLDQTSLDNGGTVTITGKAPTGKPVYVEVWAEKKVKASRFDSDVDPTTGKRPYRLYITQEMPAFYRILVPTTQKETLDKIKAEGNKWSYSKALKDLGADPVCSIPPQANIDCYQATLMGSIVGSRGELLPGMNEKETRQRALQLVKARFRSPSAIFSPNVDVKPDGTFTAKLNLTSAAPPGNYFVRAVADQSIASQPVNFQNSVSFPYIYLSNGGTSLNLLGPFFLTLVISIFGVLMGAGGGFLMNPILLTIWPLPHTVVAGTVMPTVAFSQGSGILNYSKINFISWKLGITIGLSMLLGGFIGPKLTELITLSQYKFIFGWILVVLAGLMFWQTLPGYLSKHKKEQAILKEFKRKAEEAALAKKGKLA